MTAANLNRQDVTDVFTGLMRGDADVDLGPGFAMPRGTLKTYAVEAAGATDPASALDLLHRTAQTMSARVATTRDETVALLATERSHFVVDTLDPRFWLLHTTSSARESHRFLRRLVWSQHRIDRCWFTWDFLLGLKGDDDAQWFKSDFEGRHLLPQDGVPARKLRLQLEGENVDELYGRLVALADYRNATALTALATRIRGATGNVHEFAHYSGRFVANGNSFHPHATFVARALDRYRRVVERVEATCSIGADAKEAGGYQLTGRPLTITFDRPVADMDYFLAGLFSCREPFRLWGIPREVATDVYEAQVVDLHIGATFSMSISRKCITLALPRETCGNTALRLLTNLQHQFDARAAWDLATDERRAA